MSATNDGAPSKPRPIALVTGASAGIGTELAREFAKHGYDLVLCARRVQPLEALAAEVKASHGADSHILSVDLAAAHSASTVFEFTQSNQLQIDVLVNNAGFGAQGEFVKVDGKTHLDMIQVNITSLVELTRLYLPGMIARRKGGVLNLASTAAFLPGPLMSVYYATKAFVLSFSEAIANEARESGVKVCCVCPGATRTEFQERAGMSKSKLFTGPTVMTAEAVAKLAFTGFQSGQPLVITGVFNQFAAFSTRFVPRTAAAAIARLFQES